MHKDYLPYLFKIFLTAFLYSIALFVDQTFSSPNTTAVFFAPSSGIALASLILLGPIASVGIIFAGFFSLLAFSHEPHFSAYILCFFPAIQAYFAYKVLIKLTPSPLFLASDKSIILFFIVTPFFAVISASLSLAVLYFYEQISLNTVELTWLIWWLADTFGMLILTPLFLAFFIHSNEWKIRKVVVAIPVLILIILSSQVLNIFKEQEQKKLNEQLTQISQQLNTDISSAFALYEKKLQSINSFFFNNDQPSTNDINRFLSQLNLKQDRSIYAYGWFSFADLIDKKNDFKPIFEQLKPYDNELLVTPLSTIQQQYDNCNMGSYIETYDPTIDEPKSLYRIIEASVSNINNLCSSVYLNGVAYLDLDLNHLIKRSVDHLKLNDVSIELVNSNANTPSILFKHFAHDHIDLSDRQSFVFPMSESLITYKNTFWHLRLIGFNNFMSINKNWNTWLIFVTCLFLTTVIGIGLLILTARHFQVETKVATKTKELQSSNNALNQQLKEIDQTQILIKMQGRILEIIAKENGLSNILDQLCVYAQNQIFEGATASVIFYNAKTNKINLVAAPSMDSETKQYFNKLDMNNLANPSVIAIKNNKQQIIDDFSETSQILTSLEYVHAQQIKSYWATPICSSDQHVIGVFTLTHLTSQKKTNPQEMSLMSAASMLASIAFERHNDTKELYKLSEAVKSSPNGIVITSDKGVIEYINPFFCEFTGYTENELLNNHLTDFVQDASEKDKQEFDWHYSLTLGESERHYKGVKPNGEIYWCKQTIAAMHDDQDNSNYVLSIHQDITDEYKSHQDIKFQASHDSLTGLFNLSAFESELDYLLNKTSAVNTHVLAYINLVDFNVINDKCGHIAGDQCLHSIAQLLKSLLRRTDFSARIGGEQFAIIFEHCPVSKAQIIVSNIINAILEFPFLYEDKTFRVTASAGLVEIQDSNINRIDLIHKADIASFLAKQATPERIHVYHDSDINEKNTLSQPNWHNKLLDALKDDLFILNVQPIYHLDSQEINKYEVLLRLQGQDNDIILPERFLNEAERFDLMPKIDRWVITNICDWINNNPQNSDQFFINLSSQTIEKSFSPWLIRFIKDKHIDASRLCFEINEPSALSDLPLTQQMFMNLRDIGCQFSLGGFSNGFSTFAYLKTLELDFLKINAAFVKDIEHDDIGRAMVTSINKIGHIVGAQTIAEYAANQSINDILEDIGVDYIQGFSISKTYHINELNDAN